MTNKDLLPNEIKIHSEIAKEKDIELAAFALTNKHLKTMIISLHRSPSSNVKDFFPQFNSLLDKLKPVDDITLSGDFNIDLLKKTGLSKEFLALCKQANINQPTRRTETSESLIDNVFTNIPLENVKTTVIENALSDHVGIFFEVFADNLTQKQQMDWVYSSVNLMSTAYYYTETLSDLTFDLAFLNTDEIFRNIINHFNVLFPLQKINEKPAPPPLISADEKKRNYEK